VLTLSPVFLNSKTKVKSARPGKGGRRWYKDVGLGFRTPKAAIDGQYIGTFNFAARTPTRPPSSPPDEGKNRIGGRSDGWDVWDRG
jgi:hypothetical protein